MSLEVGDKVYHIYSKQIYFFGGKDVGDYSFIYTKYNKVIRYRIATTCLVKLTKAQEYLYV